MGSIVMGRRPKLKTVVVPRQKYPEACVWQPTSNLLVLFKFFVGYSFLVSRPSGRSSPSRTSRFTSRVVARGQSDPKGGARSPRGALPRRRSLPDAGREGAAKTPPLRVRKVAKMEEAIRGRRLQPAVHDEAAVSLPRVRTLTQWQNSKRAGFPSVSQPASGLLILKKSAR